VLQKHVLTRYILKVLQFWGWYYHHWRKLNLSMKFNIEKYAWNMC